MNIDQQDLPYAKFKPYWHLYRCYHLMLLGGRFYELEPPHTNDNIPYKSTNFYGGTFK